MQDNEFIITVADVDKFVSGNKPHEEYNDKEKYMVSAFIKHRIKNQWARFSEYECVGKDIRE
jgi:hypothetical protein